MHLVITVHFLLWQHRFQCIHPALLLNNLHAVPDNLQAAADCIVALLLQEVIRMRGRGGTGLKHQRALWWQSIAKVMWF